MTVNRPFDKGSQSKETGQWQWVGLPQAVLLNGKGFYGDCNLIGGLGNVAGVATKDPTCNVTSGLILAGASCLLPPPTHTHTLLSPHTHIAFHTLTHCFHTYTLCSTCTHCFPHIHMLLSTQMSTTSHSLPNRPQAHVSSHPSFDMTSSAYSLVISHLTVTVYSPL